MDTIARPNRPLHPCPSGLVEANGLGIKLAESGFCPGPGGTGIDRFVVVDDAEYWRNTTRAYAMTTKTK